ncbi:hypothetical protein [Mycobacterium pseudokansasii]|uniref:hypothetical protein n=1 Tax=Mycobacterium pseudokansasii TaxID=2341080 RepID=UPI001C3FF1F9|nr:hypothetical protein [Mycobacterium pseudokansasii]
MQRGGIRTGGKPVGQLVKPDAGVGGLPFGVLMAVEPHLDRVREGCANLDERRPEIDVPDIKIKTRDPPVCLVERKPRHTVVADVFCRGEHILELLADPDCDHPGAACTRLSNQIWAHHLNLAVVLAEPDHRDGVVGSEALDRPAKRGAHLLDDRRRRDRITQVRGHKRHHLPAHLQIGHIAIETDPIHAVQIQNHMPIKHIVDRHCRSHDP